MAKNKKHHYVPRFYLKRFSSNGKCINLWNISSERFVDAANLKNQCYKDYFYGKDLEVEAALSQIEANVSGLFRFIDQNKYPPTHRSIEHFILVFYVLIQYGRTVYAVEALNEMHDKVMKYLLKPQAEEDGVDLSQVTIGLENISRVSLGLTMQNLPILLDLEYKLLINETDVDFVTSDNPVVFYNKLLETRMFSSNTGLASKGLQIFLPLDSNKLLLFYDPSVYRVGSNNDPIVKIWQPRDIYEINTLQMCSASENIYYQDESFDVFALHRKSVSFRRKSKVNLDSIQGQEADGQKSEFIKTSREDIRTNLRLSFVGITRSNKRWLTEFMRAKIQPAIIVRDQKLIDAHESFIKRVESQEFDMSTYFQLIEEAFCQT